MLEIFKDGLWYHNDALGNVFFKKPVSRNDSYTYFCGGSRVGKMLISTKYKFI